MEMISVQKLLVLLIWVQAGDGYWLHSLLASDTQEHNGSSESKLPDEMRTGGGGEQEEHEGSGRGWAGGAVRSRRSADASCALHSILLQVRDLGLGYDSDEMVVFKYCSGSCPRVPTNHDLILINLGMSGALPPALPWQQAPCCRPTHLEDVAFLDNSHHWHKVEKLSAASCSCMG